MLMILEDLSAEKRVRGTMSRYMPKAVVDVLERLMQGQAQVMSAVYGHSRFHDLRIYWSASHGRDAQRVLL